MTTLLPAEVAPLLKHDRSGRRASTSGIAVIMLTPHLHCRHTRSKITLAGTHSPEPGEVLGLVRWND